MKKIILSILLVFFYFLNSYCQKHDNVWQLGIRGNDLYENLELNFDYTPVGIFELPDREAEFFTCSSSYSDWSGKLKYYTNGVSIFDANHEILAGGEVINPGAFRDRAVVNGHGYGSYQAAFFIPLPDNDSLVYLFHGGLGEIAGTGLSSIDKIYYTVINSKGNNGKGAVTSANNILLSAGGGSAFKQPTANKHANGRDWWIIVPTNTQAGGRKEYKKFLFTSEGTEPMGRQQIGYGKDQIGITSVQSFSPNGEKFIEFTGAYGFSLYDFDRCSGELSNEYRLGFNDTLGFSFGAAFSMNNKFLYTSNSWFTNKFGDSAFDIENPLIIQYDLTSGDFVESADTVGFKDSLLNLPLLRAGVAFGALQLAPDGKIYSITANYKIHSIQEPNQRGKACRMMKRFPSVERGVSLTAPYYPNYRLGPIDGSSCDTLGIDNHPRANYRWENWDTLNELHIEFADLSYYEPAEWFWDFEGLGTSRDTNPEFTFPAPGIYEVCLTVSNVNSSHTTCKNVPVGEGVVDIDYVFEGNEPTVYPNPTSNAFQVYLSTSQRVEIQLFSVSGQLVLEQSDVGSSGQVDVSFLPKGIYFFNLKNKEGEVVRAGKIVVVK